MSTVSNVLLVGFMLQGIDQRARVESSPPIHTARVVILSTMLSDDFIGEWGFAALVEANGRRVLFDTGAMPATVLQNAKTIGVDLSGITDVVLSHWHGDHTGGLITLRRELMKQNRTALSRAHVGRGFFWPRKAKGKPSMSAENLKAEYQALGGSFVEHAAALELLPGVWLTGEVPRRTSERNFPKGIEVQLPDGRCDVRLRIPGGQGDPDPAGATEVLAPVIGGPYLEPVDDQRVAGPPSNQVRGQRR